MTLNFRLKEVAIAEVDGVMNPSQTVGKASSAVAIIHDSLLFEVVIFMKWMVNERERLKLKGVSRVHVLSHQPSARVRAFYEERGG